MNPWIVFRCFLITSSITFYLTFVNIAIRTSVLSKRWRELWHSFSVLIFDERKFAAKIGPEDSSNKEMMFRNYVSNSLLIRNAKKMQIRKSVLHMTSFDLLEDTPCLELWLTIAFYRNIKELDLHVGIKNGECYTLPQTVLSSKTLTGIRLSGCKLGTCNNIMLPYLQKLYLRKIPLVENFIQNLISSCHSIEDLRIIKCSGLKHLHVSNLIRLKRAEIHYCYQLKKVEISAPNLDTFWYCGKKTSPCKNIVIHEDLNNVTLPQVPDLGREIINSSACIDDALNSLLWKLHPVTLSIISPTEMYEMIKNKGEDPICCIYSSSKNKCWRHFLKDVKFEDLNDVKFEDIEEGKSRKKNVIVGPWGGNGGNSWDDGIFTGVREIKLVYGHCIDSIQVVYDRNGKPFTAEKHGGVGGNKTAEIKLQFPDEFLVSVSGHYCPVVRGGTPVIRSLTFKSNHRTFGPYGVEEGTLFTFSIDGGCVVGFKGRGDWYLDAIAFTLCNTRSKSLFQKVQRSLLWLTTTAPKSTSSKDG
ncbi:Jacalin-related lectin 19 [Glycine soja]|uniref:Mannose/glucose-specific lectin n=1 Tax=Glycine soja TaxID=3848 RepID=A0A445IEN7_GLYSO|nr:Jacalin-related lectin 19 [Glycine soja]